MIKIKPVKMEKKQVITSIVEILRVMKKLILVNNLWITSGFTHNLLKMCCISSLQKKERKCAGICTKHNGKPHSQQDILNLHPPFSFQVQITANRF